jgi:gliding motility-associatede transport system auxiliary component
MEARRRSFRQSVNLRTLKYGSHASLFTLIVLAVLVILYAVGVKHQQRFDVTSTKRFTLATQSVKLLQNLPQPIKVIGFFKREDRERTQFEDLLKQYTQHTDKLTYELVDPDRQPALAKQYNVAAYNTVVVAGKNKDEKVLRLEEEAITNAILKVTRDTKKAVYFVSGHGEASIMETERTGYSLAKKGLEDQNYEVKDLLLARSEQVPEDAAVVIVAGPRKDLLESELQTLSTYLERGGHLLLMLDPETVPALGPFVQRYGLELGNDVVIETNPLGRLISGDYLMPVVTAYERHPITKDLEGIMTIFPLVRSVSLAKDPPEGVQVQTLASTSPAPQSWAETDLKTLQEEKRVSFDEGSDRKGPISIAAVATLTPKQPASATSAAPSTEEKPGASERTARLIVFGDSEFANNSFITLQGNGDLFLNTVSWLAEEEDLMAIRPREGGGSGPVILTAAKQPLIFWLPVVALPLAVFGCGTLVFVRRRWQQ